MKVAELQGLDNLQAEASQRGVIVRLWLQLDDGDGILWFADIDQARYALQFLGEERILK